MSYNLFSLFVIVISLFVLHKLSHLKIERYVKIKRYACFTKHMFGTWDQARFDVISRYTLVRIIIGCDRCQCRRLIEHFH